MESLYAVLIPIGGEVLCSTVYAFCILGLWLSMILVVHQLAPGWPASVATALWIPLFAVNSFAPTPAGNDMVAAWFLFFGIMFFLRCEIEGKTPETLWGSGLLIGEAIACKPICLPFAGMAFLVLFFNRRPTLERAKTYALFTCWMVLFYTPWAIRGILTTGLPIFPLGAGVFPINPDFQAAFATSRSLNHLYSMSFSGLFEAFTLGLKHKLTLGMYNGEVLFFLVPILCFIALIIQQNRQRLPLLILLGMFAPILMINGETEIFRYGALCFPIGIVVAGFLFQHVEQSLKPRFRQMLFVIILASTVFHFSGDQWRVASFKTFQWPFRPLLSPQDQLAFAQRAEKGAVFLDFKHLRPLIPEGERVLLTDCLYPYYLNRPALWNDEAIKSGGLQDQWQTMTTADAKLLFEKEEISWVLIMNRSRDESNTLLCNQLIAEGIVQEIPTPEQTPNAWLLKVVIPTL